MAMGSQKLVTKLQRENEQLRKILARQTSLNKIAMTICSAQSLNQILDHIVQECVESIDTEKGVAILPQKQGSPFRIIIQRDDSGESRLPFTLDDVLTEWMTQNRQPLLINDINKGDLFLNPDGTGHPYQSLLCVPLVLKDDTVGIIALFNKKGNPGRFNEEDEKLLLSISIQSVQVIEKFRLLDQETRLLRMDEDLHLAQHIQEFLFPVHAPNLKGYELFSRTVPAKQVGGDYYDYLTIDETKTAICVADISGKGLAAALLMANLQATVRSQTMMKCSTKNCYHTTSLTTACFIGNCMERINSLLHNSTTPEKYATMLYGVLDTSNHQFMFTNAGHTQPILFRPNGVHQKLCDTSMPIGLFDHIEHKSQHVTFEPGETLLIYSDGVTDSVNIEDEEYGEQRLIDFVHKYVNLPPNQLANAIIGDVSRFAGKAERHDDVTVMILRRNGASSS